MRLILFALLTPSLSLAAQSLPPPSPSLQAISITNSKADPTGYRLFLRDGALTAENVTLPALLHFAYGLREDVIVNLPSWSHTAHFDITAKVIGVDPQAFNKLPNPQRAHLMAQLLVDRFHLQTHMENRVQPAQDLIIAKGGPHLRAAEPTDHAGTLQLTSVSNPHTIHATITTARLAVFLEDQIHHPVVDKTALPGLYTFDFSWAADNNIPGGVPIDAHTVATIPAALEQQLGLKLVPAKEPIPTLVIDHIDRP